MADSQSPDDEDKNLAPNAITTTDIKPKGRRTSRAQPKEAATSQWLQHQKAGSIVVASPSTQSTNSTDSSTSSSSSSINSAALLQKLSSSTTLTGRVRLIESNEHHVRLRHDSLSAAMALSASPAGSYGARRQSAFCHTPMMYVLNKNLIKIIEFFF
jgi:hypothetical protein